MNKEWNDEKLLDELWDETQRSKTKLGQKVYNWLNYDNLNAIITDGNRYWTELVCSGSDYPKYAYDYIERFMAKKGYINLYKEEV